MIVEARTIALAFTLLFAACSGGASIHDPSALPETLESCGRQWSKGDHPPASRTAVESEQGVTMVVVDPSLVTACPAGACTDVAGEEPCHTVIWARVGVDAYVPYELQGGP